MFTEDTGCAPVARPLPPRTDWNLTVSELLPMLGAFGASEMEGWERKRPAVVPAFREAACDLIYRVRPEDVLPFMNPPMDEWPFPAGAHRRDWEIEAIEDMPGGLPLVHGFQRFVETHGRVPTWKETCRWFQAPEQAEIFMIPAWELYRNGTDRKGVRHERRHTPERWRKGIVWRIGKAYLSFLREMDFLSRMIHVHGVPLRVHLLADAVLKVDCWFGNHALRLYIPNGKMPRKTVPSAAEGLCHVLDVPLGTGTCYGENEDGTTRRLAWNEINRATERVLRSTAARILRGADPSA